MIVLSLPALAPAKIYSLVRAEATEGYSFLSDSGTLLRLNKARWVRRGNLMNESLPQMMGPLRRYLGKDQKTSLLRFSAIDDQGNAYGQTDDWATGKHGLVIWRVGRPLERLSSGPADGSIVAAKGARVWFRQDVQAGSLLSRWWLRDGILTSPSSKIQNFQLKSVDTKGSAFGSSGGQAKGQPAEWTGDKLRIFPLPKGFVAGTLIASKADGSGFGNVIADSNYSPREYYARPVVWTMGHPKLMETRIAVPQGIKLLSPPQTDLITPSGLAIGHVFGQTANGVVNRYAVAWPGGHPVLLSSLCTLPKGTTLYSPLSVTRGGLVLCEAFVPQGKRRTNGVVVLRPLR